jgi:hypothetical protein
VALPWDRRPDPERGVALREVDDPGGGNGLHIYFPTEDRLGRALLVHGDFYVDSSRRHIETLGAGGDISRRRH